MTTSSSRAAGLPLRTIGRDAPILLGSASPRRREILGALGLPYVVRPADVDESQLAGDTPETFLERVVWDKLHAAERKRGNDPFSCVLVADTIVVLGDRILGKPRDVEDSERLVASLVGQSHTVFTRFGLSWETSAGERVNSSSTSGETVRRCVTVASQVTMRQASPAEVRAYALTGEGADKAGAYALQGLGSFLVSHLDGSFSGVVGLPACEVVEELTKVGLLTDFPRVF